MDIFDKCCTFLDATAVREQFHYPYLRPILYMSIHGKGLVSFG